MPVSVQSWCAGPTGAGSLGAERANANPEHMTTIQNILFPVDFSPSCAGSPWAAPLSRLPRSPLPQAQSPAMFVQADISTAEGVKAVVDRIAQEWGGIDILINCVGGSNAPAAASPC